MKPLRQLAARIRRLHPFTWCVTLLVTATLVLIVVPGDEIPYDEQNPWTLSSSHTVRAELLELEDVDELELHPFKVYENEIYVHGWPFTCVIRGIERRYVWDKSSNLEKVRSEPLIEFENGWGCCGPMQDQVNWSNYDNWPWESDVTRVHYRNLFFSVVVFAILVGGAAWVVEWWIRSRGGILRFRIIDGLYLTSAVCVGLTWYQHHVAVQKVEQEVWQYFSGNRQQSLKPFETGDLQFEPVSIRYDYEEKYLGPAWLSRLVGNEDLLPMLHHVHHVSLRNATASWKEDYHQIARLRYVSSITLPEGFPLEGIEILRGMPNLKSVTVQDHGHDWLSPTQNGERLPSLTAENLEELERMELESITISGPRVLAEDVRQVARFSGLRALHLEDVSVTIAELHSLRSDHPSLEITANWYDDVASNGEPPPGHERRVEQMKSIRTGEFQPLILIDDSLPFGVESENPSGP